MNREEQIKMWEAAANSREFTGNVPTTPLSPKERESAKRVFTKNPHPHRGGIHPESPLAQKIYSGEPIGFQQRRK